MSECKRVAEIFAEHDGDGLPEEVRAHIETCEKCSEFYGMLQATQADDASIAAFDSGAVAGAIVQPVVGGVIGGAIGAAIGIPAREADFFADEDLGFPEPDPDPEPPKIQAGIQALRRVPPRLLDPMTVPSDADMRKSELKSVETQLNRLRAIRDHSRWTPEQILKAAEPDQRNALCESLRLPGMSPEKIVQSIRKIAGYSWMNVARARLRERRWGSVGVDYREVVLDVAEREKIETRRGEPVASIEEKIIKTQFDRYLEKLSPEEREALLARLDELAEEMGYGKTFAKQAGVGGVLVAAKLSGFGVYLLASTVVGSISGALGVALPFAFYTTMSTVLSVAIPGGIAATAGWAAFTFMKPNRKKALLAVLHIAAMRLYLLNKQEETIVALERRRAWLLQHHDPAEPSKGSTGMQLEGVDLAESLVQAARVHLAADNNAGLVKLRQLGEVVGRILADFVAVDSDGFAGQFELLQALVASANIPTHIIDGLHRLRLDGNRAAHDHLNDEGVLGARLEDADTIVSWMSKLRSDSPDDHGGSHEPTDAPTLEPTALAPSEDLIVIEEDPNDVAPDGWPTPAARCLQILRAIEREAASFGLPTKLIAKAQADFRQDVEAALAPFCLGIVGEFRSGKSMLINALVGSVMALTDVEETTAVMSAYGAGNVRQARWRFRNGTEETTTIEEANQRLDTRRKDREWLATVEEVYFTSPSVVTKDWLLWDGPGLGGDEFNEEVANRFISRVSAAIWVLDAELLGVASIVAPIEALRAAGKPVLAVLNRIDCIEKDQVAEAVEFLQNCHEGMFVDVIPLSAKLALDAALTRKEYKPLVALIETTQTQLVDQAENNRELRLSRALKRGVGLGIEALRATARPVREQLALLEHVQFGINQVITRVVAGLPSWITEQSDFLWIDTERKLAAEVLERGDSGATKLRQLNGLLETADRCSDLREAWDRVAAAVTNEAATEWAQQTRDEIRITNAAMPELYASAAQISQHEGIDDPVEEGIADGAVVTVVSAAVLAAVAAASAAITWPIMLAALPIGLVAGFIRKEKIESELEDDPERVLRTYEKRIRQIFEAKRRHLEEAAMSSLPPSIEAHLQAHSMSRLKEMQAKLFGGREPADVEGLLARLDESERQFASVIRSSSHPQMYLPDGGSEGSAILHRVVQEEDVRIDVAVPSIPPGLGVLFEKIRPDVPVRILVSVDEGQEADLKLSVQQTLGAWTGRLELRNLRLKTGASIPGPSFIVTSRGAWDLTGLLAQLADSTMTVPPFHEGRLVAERVFASRFAGIPLGVVDVVSNQIR